MENTMDSQHADTPRTDDQDPVDENVRTTTENLDESVQTVRKVARSAVLASVGLAGLAYDQVKSLWNGGANLLQKAEKRGEQMESDFSQRVTELEERTKSEIQKAKEQTQQNVRQNVDRVVRRTKSEAAETAESTLAETGVATQDQVTELSQDIAVVEEKVEQLAEPLPGYSTMSATAIKERLEGLQRSELEAIREYELAHANRRTLIEAVDQRIAALHDQ